MTQQEHERMKNFLDWYSSNQEAYAEFAQLVLRKIREALKERQIIIAFSSAREKAIPSLEKKCQKTIKDEKSGKYVLKYTNPKNEITDFAGVRIVAYLKSDITEINNVVENLFDVDYENSGDKIDSLTDREIGYLSMHYIVSLKEFSYETNKFKNFKCEVQVRTILQDAWAQIFHDRQYKGILDEVTYSHEITRKTNLIAGALELIDNQINDLVSEYDSFNIPVIDEREFQVLLESEITISSVSKYCIKKSKGRICRYYNADSTISQLKSFDINYIRDLNYVVQDNFIDAVMKINQITIDKLISYILIIADAQKYFSLPTANTIKSISKDGYNLLNSFLAMDQICEEYHITVE